MCGIIGYIGNENSVKRIIEGLYALEYRGYDSAGVAAFDGDGKLCVIKSEGRIKNVEEKIIASHKFDVSYCGIGHTRWATHGEPSDRNSHPHGSALVQIVHNGIIENYAPLRAMLKTKGYVFESETDTEVAAKLIDCFYQQSKDPVDAIRKAMQKIVGSYAVGVVFAGMPDRIYAFKKDNPLIIGCGENENYIASDITAILHHTNKYYQLGDLEIAVIEKDKIEISDLEGNRVQKELMTATWDVEAAERGGYPHFMIKEINEEPDAVKKTLHPRIKNSLPDFSEENIDEEILKNAKSIRFVACGTAMHAGLAGANIVEKLAGIPTRVEIASEFRYNNPIIGKGDLVIVISQSGETADSLAAIRLAKEKGAYTLGIVNVIGSTIAREADGVIYTWAGPEIAVASTKAYTVQVALLFLLAIRLGMLRGRIDDELAASYTKELTERVPDAISEAIAMEESIRNIAREFKDSENLFFIGRGIDYNLAMEGSLKLKEISYIHSEAYAAGELKHGTISLITNGIPVIAIATVDSLYEKMISNIREVKARGARILTICKGNAKDAAAESDFVITLPHVSEMFEILPAATVLQLFAYHVSALRGCDVDKPRNLAKSVTVE